MARDDDNRQIGVSALDHGQNLKTIEAAALQPDIEDDQVGPAIFNRFQRLITVACQSRPVPFIFKNARNQIPDVGFVVDD